MGETQARQKEAININKIPIFLVDDLKDRNQDRPTTFGELDPDKNYLINICRVDNGGEIVRGTLIGQPGFHRGSIASAYRRGHVIYVQNRGSQ